MTIYTDKVTGKKYDRIPGGYSKGGRISGYKPCAECAFDLALDLAGEACSRGNAHCCYVTTSGTHNKTVFFVFQERTA